jgi:xylan 1,4-beta-xylosidase
MRKHSQLITALAISLFVCASGRPAHATNYTITVDASKQTAGNPRFWSAAVGTGTASLTLRSDLQTHYKIGNRELGMLRVRGHGVLNDDIGIYKGAGSYDWTKFDAYLNAIVSAGMRPIMELSFMPTALALKGNSRDAPKDYATYRNFITAVVQHCVDKYGATDVGQWYWEVWNEPDYAGFWNGTDSSASTATKMTEYYTLYDNAVDAITAVLPNALVGGPATTEPGKIAAFLQHCKSANKRVSFASSHVYPGGAASGSSAPAVNLVNDNNTRTSQISSGGYTTATVKSFNTEWNSSYSGQGGGTGDVVVSMDNHWNAPFILKGIKLMSDKNSGDTPPIDVFSYWVLSDVFDESSGPSGSYILGKNGTLPFGSVFGLMTFQGVRKASFNAFKMLNYLGPKRLMSSGGTSSDGVDAMATMSSAGDEVQTLVYNTYNTLNTSGSTDMVTVTLSNLPTALAGKEVFVTHFRVDETHSNPYSVWAGQNKPTAPTEAQWQAMKAQQHLALLTPVTKATISGTTYTNTFSIPRQAGSLLIIGLKRPVTGRNAFVEVEGEDYDGQSGATKEDSGDSTTVGQSIALTSGGSAFYNVVDFSDAGAGAVQLRVNAQAATTLTLRLDSATGTAIGTCQVTATSGWATQTCNLTGASGVHTLYAVAGGAMRLNYMKFQPGASTTGTGGNGGSGSGGAGGATGAGGRGGTTGSGTGGSAGPGAGGSGATGSGGVGSGAAGSSGPGIAGSSGGDPAGSAGTGGGDTGSAGTSGSNPAGSAGTGGGDTGSAGTTGSVTGAAGTSAGPGAGGSAPMTGGGAGCACGISGNGDAPAVPLIVGVVAIAFALYRRRPRRAQ